MIIIAKAAHASTHNEIEHYFRILKLYYVQFCDMNKYYAKMR